MNFVENTDRGPIPNLEFYNFVSSPEIRFGSRFLGEVSRTTLAVGVVPQSSIDSDDSIIFANDVSGDVIFANDKNWTINSTTGIDFLQVAVHEIGHALGLVHEESDVAIMNPMYKPGEYSGLGTSFLHEDDIEGIQYLYGSGTGSVIPLTNYAPQALSFELNKTTYQPNESLFLKQGWIRDSNGVRNLSNVDVWTKNPDGRWIEQDDITEFTAWEEDSRWAKFDYQLDNLVGFAAGEHTFWLKAYDLNGGASAAEQTTFTVNNAAPTELNFQFNRANKIYNPGETLKITEGWVKDLNGSSDLVSVDFWLKQNTNSWKDIKDATDIRSWSGGVEWGRIANYQLDLTGYAPGSYGLWGRAYDQSGAKSDQKINNFTVKNSAPIELQFQLNRSSSVYNAGETLSLKEAWVKDLNGAADLASVDFWLQRDGDNWQDIGDVTNFTQWSEGVEWGRFNYQLNLSNYTSGNYTLWAGAYDRSGAISNTKTTRFEISGSNSSFVGSVEAFTGISDSVYYLGDETTAYYNQNGNQDYAVIEMFSKTNDLIVL